MFSQLFAVAFLLQQPTQAPIARIAITPAAPTVVAGDTLRLRAQALDAAGRPVTGANIMFQAAGRHIPSSLVTTNGHVVRTEPRVPAVIAVKFAS